VRQRIVWALCAVRDAGAAVLCGTADDAFAAQMVEHGGRKINLDQGRIVGAPAVGLVPAFTPAPISVDIAQRVASSDADEGGVATSPATRGPA